MNLNQSNIGNNKEVIRVLQAQIIAIEEEISHSYPPYQLADSKTREEIKGLVNLITELRESIEVLQTYSKDGRKTEGK